MELIPNWTLIVLMVNFLILLVVLNRLLIEPLLNVMEQRRNETEGKQNKAKDMEREAEEAFDEYEEKLKQAKIEATAERTAIRNQGLQEQENILESARKTGDATLQSIRGQVGKEVDAARADLYRQADEMASSIFVKLLGRDPS